MKRTPLLNTKLVQHMDVPTIPNVLMLDAGESLEDQVFVRGDLLDAESIDIYFKNTKYKLLNVFDVVTAKLRNHISDTVCHTNPIEKRYWNNKVDASRYEAAMSIVQERLHALEEIIKGVPDGVDFSSFITYDKLIDILSDRDTWPLDIDGYVKEGEKLGTINGVDFYQGDSITIGSTGPDDPDAPSISYTANITSSTANSYKIGTLNVGTNSHFDLYGKDTYGGDGSSSPYTLPVASSNALGGIKVGYTRGNNDSDRNYAVQLSPDNKAFVYVPWINTSGGGDDPDDPEEKKDKIITLTESEFNALDNAGELEPDTTYIVLDDETGVVKFICYVDKNGVKHITTMPENTHEELKAEELTLAQWNSMSDADKDMNTIYIVYSGTGANKALIGLGISKVLTRVPVPANGTVVRLTQAEYDNLGANLDQGTLYLIVANNTVVKMYLGSIEIPVGSDNEEAVIKSILTTMFSEKVTWEGDEAKSLNWSIIDVDNPGEFYAATGFEDLVKNTVKEAGFISKTDNTNNFAEMFATLVGLNGDIVKKASILASINASGESNVKISADKINVDGVFNQYAQSADKKSATQLLSDGSKIAARAQVVEDGVLRATEVTATPGVFEISAVTVDNNDSETSNALFRISTQAKGSEAYIKADSIYLDGNTTVEGKFTAQSADIASLVAENASIKQLYATNANVNALLANYATINDLTADRARITNLETNQLTVSYLTGGDATFKGDVNAKSLQVINNSDNLSIKFTAYDPNTMNWPGLVASGINAGEPVGIIYNQEAGHANEPLYFFDFAPVDPGTFSVTPELTYRITQGATGKVNIVAGPIVYKITECTKDSSKIGKYVTPAVNEGSINYMSPLISRSDLYQAFETRNLIVRSGNTYNIVRCQIWKKVNFAGGVKSEYISGNEQRGYITELQDNSNIGNGINAYIIETASNAQTMSEQYSSFTKYMVSGNSEISSSVVYNSQYDVYELNTGDAIAAMIGSNNNSNTTDIVQYNVFVPSSYIRKQSSIIV